MMSTVDPDARHVHRNRTRHQGGFTGHASFEPEVNRRPACSPPLSDRRIRPRQPRGRRRPRLAGGRRSTSTHPMRSHLVSRRRHHVRAVSGVSTRNWIRRRWGRRCGCRDCPPRPPAGK
ncbi:Transposase, IS4 family protein [Streptomyces clavuligerus]|uniref:Transposase, IS4 family protein n=1 Tax=Streptomyces clavuligerus TaxID=1901 RepID=E2PZA3_STRCL|nr:Transposase, IS4 family protein [Streptomyces clavuligerus]